MSKGLTNKEITDRFLEAYDHLEDALKILRPLKRSFHKLTEGEQRLHRRRWRAYDAQQLAAVNTLMAEDAAESGLGNRPFTFCGTFSAPEMFHAEI